MKSRRACAMPLITRVRGNLVSILVLLPLALLLLLLLLLLLSLCCYYCYFDLHYYYQLPTYHLLIHMSSPSLQLGCRLAFPTSYLGDISPWRNQSSGGWPSIALIGKCYRNMWEVILGILEVLPRCPCGFLHGTYPATFMAGVLNILRVFQIHVLQVNTHLGLLLLPCNYVE